jgi:hypothetical protein
MIAEVLIWTDPEEWNSASETSLKSGEIYLEAGRQYYVEVLH